MAESGLTILPERAIPSILLYVGFIFWKGVIEAES
jgi:hypothetical protein